MSRPKVKRCPKCGCTDELVLIELHSEYGETDPGTIRVDASGALIAPSLFDFSPVTTLRVQIACDRCQHQWTPRGGRISSETPEHRCTKACFELKA